MSVMESVVVALFIWALVFVVLAVLCTIVLVLSKVLGLKANRKTAVEDSAVIVTPAGTTKDMDVVQLSSGELKLKNVDEKTAAMIMAIVSDESGIPLSELCFKSIKAMD